MVLSRFYLIHQDHQIRSSKTSKIYGKSIIGICLWLILPTSAEQFQTEYFQTEHFQNCMTKNKQIFNLYTDHFGTSESHFRSVFGKKTIFLPLTPVISLTIQSRIWRGIEWCIAKFSVKFNIFLHFLMCFSLFICRLHSYKQKFTWKCSKSIS